MWAGRCKLVHAALTKPSRMSIANQGAWQLRKLWRSIVRRCTVVLLDNRWHALFRANPVKSSVYLHATAIALLLNTPLPLSLGQPSPQDLVDRVDTVTIAVVAQHRENLNVFSNVCNAPVSRRTMCAPLDIAREAGRRQIFCNPFGIYESRTRHNQELLDLLDMLRSTQLHCQNSMALLVDRMIHCGNHSLEFSVLVVLHTQDGLHILRGLDALVNYYHLCHLDCGALTGLLHLGRAPMDWV